ncbi:hypothetical protein D3C76_1614330 [compost metagenome]
MQLLKRWEIIIVVLPLDSSVNFLYKDASANGSKEAAGSSSMISSEERKKARLIAIFCHWPPDNSVPPLKLRPN